MPRPIQAPRTVLAGDTLTLREVSRRYGTVDAVQKVSLSINRGEFVTLLGPSGSGKTTILMMIAGFVQPSGGEILLDGRDIAALPPERRDFGMVFQGYALFPHLTVAENIAFPLRIRGWGRAQREDRVRRTIDLVQLDRHGGKLPAQLSGGQQQRVALARALAFDPAVLLLDEPLSALDKKLRAEMQEELKALHARVGRTFVNVTHDQEEALSLSDRIAILNHGRLVQLDRPAVLYDHPASRFVAGFLGRANFLEGTIDADRVLRIGDERLPTMPHWPSGHAVFSLRPERIRLLAVEEAEQIALPGRCVSTTYFGAVCDVVVDTPVGALRVSVPAAERAMVPLQGDQLRLGWSTAAMAPVLEDA
jgi:putative spermidine/putrescine transport system ATP-binding protein